MKSLKFHRTIVAIAIMLIGWLPSLAHHFEINGVFYNVISTTEVEVTYKGSSYDEFNSEYNGSVVIPSLVEYGGFTYSVTSIGNSAFYYCLSLTGIEIPNSVTSIGEYAFSQCYNLTDIEIPNSVKSIGGKAFYDCYSLTGIEIPNSVTSIGDCAFGGCSDLTSIVVDAGNSKYDSRNGCNAIIETVSNTLITGCQNTIIPNSVTSIGDCSFGGCSDLTSIEIPNSVKSIGYGAFSGCSSLRSIQIGNSVTSIGDDAFTYCTILTSIEIPNSVKSIGDYAFHGCYGLTSIEIPNSVTSIGDYAFHECPGLTSIVVDSGNTKYDSRNGCNAIIETASNTLIAGCQNTIIPNSVTSIGEYAFYGCTSLISIEIPNSVTSIGNFAFAYCESLTRIICTATTPPTIESDTFSEYSAFLFVPIDCKATYEVADYWENFNNIIEVTLDAPIMLNDNDAIVATIGENIVVKNATAGSVVRVYTVDGALIASEVATEGDVVIEAPAKGIYVVTVGKQTVKVII